MRNEDILNKLNELHNDSDSYLMFQVEDKNYYFGKDRNGNIVYMMDSFSQKIPSICQETHSLFFVFNKRCCITCDEKTEHKVMHTIVCKEKDEERIKAFIRLTKAFSEIDKNLDQYYFAKLFSSISSLFDKKRKVSEFEIQGLFAELYSILYLRDKKCDIAKYWQSKDRMKFDFSINTTKRLEIKSTLKSHRVHHFRHDQLLGSMYDIKIVSVMLQKNDQGISIIDLVDIIREEYSDDYSLMLHIDSIISQIDEEYLLNIRYDKIYIDKNIRFFDVKAIPHFNEKTPDGVFNAEYDCDLETTDSLSIEELIEWIKGE